uniref:PDZ domain-containing protein n=1 Tax=Macrostomum lignano TaxID=282301 RepID=A0A1I8IF51_9PLAT
AVAEDVEMLLQAKPAPVASAGTTGSGQGQKSRSIGDFSNTGVWSNRPTVVELDKTPAGLGFSVLDYQDPLCAEQTVIIIRSLVPGGAAHRDGRLLPGDRLLFVNETNLERASLEETVHCLKAAPRGRIVLGVAKPCPLAQAERRAAKAAEAAAARQGRMTRKKSNLSTPMLAGQYIPVPLSSAALAMSPTPSSPVPSGSRLDSIDEDLPTADEDVQLRAAALREELGSAFDLLAPQSGAPMLPPPQPQPPQTLRYAGGDTTTASESSDAVYRQDSGSASRSTTPATPSNGGAAAEAAADEQSDEEAALNRISTEIVQLTMASVISQLVAEQAQAEAETTAAAAAAAADRSDATQSLDCTRSPSPGSSAYAKEDAEDELQRISRGLVGDAIAGAKQLLLLSATAAAAASLAGSSSTASLASIVSSSSGDMLIELEGVRDCGSDTDALFNHMEIQDADADRYFEYDDEVDFTVNNVGNGVRERERASGVAGNGTADMCSSLVDEGQQQQLVNGGESTTRRSVRQPVDTALAESEFSNFVQAGCINETYL